MANEWNHARVHVGFGAAPDASNHTTDPDYLPRLFDSGDRATVYHVDRFAMLQEGQANGFDAQPYNFSFSGRKLLDQYFPPALSRFGKRHVLEGPVFHDGEGKPHLGDLQKFGGRQALEFVWEQVRKDVNDHLISRLSSSFACDSLEDARLFARDRYERDGSNKKSWPTPEVTIYRLDAVVNHRADMNWLPWGGGLTNQTSAFTLDHLVGSAQAYWRGADRNEGRPFTECLLSSWVVKGVEETYDASESGSITPQGS
jgi:hypothetical protein